MSLWHPFPFRDHDVMSFRTLDGALEAPKGTAFRAFKRALPVLEEGRDFLRLEADRDAGAIAELKAAGRVYPSSVHVVLLTASGMEKAFRNTV